MRHEKRQGDASQKEDQARHHPRWDKRVIRSLDDEESVDPKERMVAEMPRASGRTFMTRASGRS